MTPPETSAGRHPAPHAERVSLLESFFGLFAGPAAWLIQLSAGYALASNPCFRSGSLAPALPPALRWTWPTMLALTAAAVAISVASFLMSLRAFNRTRHETVGDSNHLMELGSGRTRFLALWGMVLGAAFAVGAAITGIAFATVPSCAG